MTAFEKILLQILICAGLMLVAGSIGYQAGASSAHESAELEQRRKDAIAHAEIVNQQLRADEAEHFASAQIARAEQAYEESRNVQKKNDQLAADLRAGRERLRIQVAACNAPADGLPAAAARAGSGDAAGTAELPPALAGDLVALADECSDLANRLTLAQQVIRAWQGMYSDQGNE